MSWLPCRPSICSSPMRRLHAKEEVPSVPRAKLALTPKICSREGCPLKGEYHSKCKAHKRDSTPCMGQVITGQLVCRMHGGQEPNAIKAAKQRVAYQDAMSLA